MQNSIPRLGARSPGSSFTGRIKNSDFSGWVLLCMALNLVLMIVEGIVSLRLWNSAEVMTFFALLEFSSIATTTIFLVYMLIAAVHHYNNGGIHGPDLVTAILATVLLISSIGAVYYAGFSNHLALWAPIIQAVCILLIVLVQIVPGVVRNHVTKR